MGSPSAAASATRSACAFSNVRMNSRPMILRLVSGSLTPASAVEELLLGVDRHEPHARRRDIVLFDLSALVFAQQTVVDEHADELVADRLVHERCSDRGVDASAQRADDFAAAHLGADGRDLIGDDIAAVPVGRDSGRAVQEVLEHTLAVGRVLDLGVPLHAVELLLVAREGGHRSRCRGGEHDEAVRRLRDRVAVAHPGRLFFGLAVEQDARVAHGDVGRSVLALAGVRDLAAEGRRHHLEAVADAEHRHAEFEDLAVELRSTLFVDARGSAGEHDSRRALRDHLGRSDRVRNDLGVDARLAHTSCDQLRVLGAEVDDEYRTGRIRTVGAGEHVGERGIGANGMPPRGSLLRPRGRPDRFAPAS